MLPSFPKLVSLRILLYVLFPLLSLAVTPSLRGELFLFDDFTYPDAPITADSVTGWVTHSGSAQEAIVQSGVLHLSHNGSEDIHKGLEPTPAGSVYLAFDLMVLAPPVTPSYFAHFKEGNRFRCRLWLLPYEPDPEKAVLLGISSASGSQPEATSAQPLLIQSPARIILKADPETGAADLWLNPADPTAAPNLSLVEGPAFLPQAWAFRQSSGMGRIIVDNLAIAASLEELSPQNALPPHIQSEPDDLTVLAGEPVQFQVLATGSPPLQFAWHFNGQLLPGAPNAPRLDLPAASPADAGAYSVLVSNPHGTQASRQAELVVLESLPRPAGIYIAEFLANPAPDQNPLGREMPVHSSHAGVDDEFLELVNLSSEPIDLSGWTLSDAVTVRHVFPNRFQLPPFIPVVVYGGDRSGSAPLLPQAIAMPASEGATGLALNNGGDTIRLHDATGNLMLEVTYHADDLPDSVSLQLHPLDASGTFQPHSAIGAGPSSPGFNSDGAPYLRQPATVPSLQIRQAASSLILSWHRADERLNLLWAKKVAGPYLILQSLEPGVSEFALSPDHSAQFFKLASSDQD